MMGGVLSSGYYVEGESQLDAKFAAARGHVDAIVTPEETRDQLAFALHVVSQWSGPHLGAFVLPPFDRQLT